MLQLCGSCSPGGFYTHLKPGHGEAAQGELHWIAPGLGMVHSDSQVSAALHSQAQAEGTNPAVRSAGIMQFGLISSHHGMH